MPRPGMDAMKDDSQVIEETAKTLALPRHEASAVPVRIVSMRACIEHPAHGPCTALYHPLPLQISPVTQSVLQEAFTAYAGELHVLLSRPGTSCGSTVL
jgi:hypothetical protein